MTIPGEVVQRAGDLVESRLGLDVSGSRRADLERALHRLIELPDTAPPEQWLGRLGAVAADGRRWQQLVSLITVGESFFFRDPGFLQTLQEVVLAPLVERRRTGNDLRLRIWSAGCASGEEPYSLAILVDSLLPDGSRWDVKILGSDVDAASLEVARRGIYRDWALRQAPSWIRQRYFRERGDGSAEIVPWSRTMVELFPLNLAQETYPSLATRTVDLDLVVCRNVLMYLTEPVQEAVAGRLARCLAPGGWLAVTAAEARPSLFRSLEPAPVAETALFRRSERAAASPITADRPWGDRGTPASSPVGRRAPAGAPAPSAVRLESGAAPASAPMRQQARAAADRGDLASARRWCELALAEDPLDGEARLLMAAVHQETGSLADAERELRKAVFAAPDSPVAQLLLGGLLLRRGERARARGCFGAAMALLSSMPRDAFVPGSDGFTAGLLLDAAREQLAAAR